MTCPHRHDDGAYVLGALNPAERAEYEQHLAGCADCRDAVRQLVPLPGLLGRVDPGELAELASQPQPQPSPEPTRLQQLVGEVIRIRRRRTRVRRWQLGLAAAAAAVVAAVGGVVVTAAVDGPQGPPPTGATTAMEPVSAAVPIAAQLRITSTSGGTKVWMECRYPEFADEDYEPPVQPFRLVAVSGDGATEQLGSWWAGTGDRVELTGMTSMSEDDLQRIELRDAVDTVLLAHHAPD